MNVQGKTAVITGASRGIGAGLAEEFAAHGLNLGLCARTLPKVDSEAHTVCAEADVADLSSMTEFCDRVLQRFGKIDLWINNAGILDPIAPLRDITSADFARQLQINVLGVMHGSQLFAHHVRNREGAGVLVNISSGAGRKAYAGWSAYCACKAAVDRLTECLQLEERDAGLRAYAVAPGVVDTDMQALIRECSREQFPQVDRFRTMKAENAFNTSAGVARALLALVFDESTSEDEVLVRLPENLR